MRFRRWLPFVAVCGLITIASGTLVLTADETLDYATLTRIRDEALGRSQVVDQAGWLTDVYGPRLTGSRTIEQAADWAAKKFSEWGLTNVHRERFAFGKGWSLVRFNAHMVEPQIQPLIGLPKTWSPGTPGVVTADVMLTEIRTEADLAKYRGKLAGKIVLTQPARAVEMLEGTLVSRWDETLLKEAEQTPFTRTDPFLHVAPAARGRQSGPTLQEQIQQFFKAEGVVAALDRGSDEFMVRGDNQMSWMTQRTDGGTVFAGHGGPRDDNSANMVPSITLAVEHYNRMVRILQKGVPVKVELDVRVDVRNETQPNGFNLIADLPGTDLAQEIVLLGAHLDSYPWATGATDNAAGVAVLMETMRVLSAVGAKPRRTIRLALWGGEENGLLGSRAYVREHLADPDTMVAKPGHTRLSAYYNLDNGTGRIRGIWLQGNLAAESIFRAWLPPLRDLGVITVVGRSVRGSDYASFDEVGIPAFQFMQDRLEYNSRTHHSNMDFFDRLSRDDLVQMVPVVATFAYNTAARPDKLPRKPMPPPPPGRPSSTSASPQFEPVQPDLFARSGGQPNAWADFDADGDLDLFVGFRGAANRLYRNDRGVFAEVAATLGVADDTDTRAAAWGDFDSDGRPDLYVGFTRRSETANRLYRNAGKDKKFIDVGVKMGVDAKGETRQISWIDYDNDGDLDLFVAFRDAPNALYRNDGTRFVNVAPQLGLDDARKTVGAVWFDMEQDGDLDVYVANQDGTLNGLFRNDGRKFVDVAAALGVDGANHPRTGSNGPSVVDYDNDGDLDLFVANYGPNFLFRNNGDGTFTDVATQVGVAGGEKATPSAWGDYDNDGRADLYVSSYIDKPVNGRDYLYSNQGARFSEAMPAEILKHPASHGIQWADFDRDGDLDLALADNNPNGTHYVYRNLLPAERAGRSLQVLVMDAQGRHTAPGSEVRVFAAGSSKVIGTRIVDTGSGYCSQGITPVHIGLGDTARVDVEVTYLTRAGRKSKRVANVDPRALAGRALIVKGVGDSGTSEQLNARPRQASPRSP